VLAEGDCYEGDLLNAVLSVEEGYWRENAPVKKILQEKIPVWRQKLEELNTGNTYRQLLKAISSFELK
jgi:hypothetical protein